MFCEKCGAKIEDDSLFCSECGNKVSDAIRKEFAKKETQVPKPVTPVPKPVTPVPKAEAPKAPAPAPKQEAPKAPAPTPKPEAPKAPAPAPKAPAPAPVPKPAETKVTETKVDTPVQQSILGKAPIPGQDKADTVLGKTTAEAPKILPKVNPGPFVKYGAKEEVKPETPQVPRGLAEMAEAEEKAKQQAEIDKKEAENRAAIEASRKAKEDKEAAKEAAKLERSAVKPVSSNNTSNAGGKKSPLPIIIIIVVIVLLLIGGILGFLLLSGSDDKSDKDDDKKVEKDIDDEDDEDADEAEAEEIAEEPEEVKEDPNVPAHELYENFIAGEQTVAYDDRDYTFVNFINEAIVDDPYFAGFDHDLTLGVADVKFAYADLNGDEIDELILAIASSNGDVVSDYNYAVLSTDNNGAFAANVILLNNTVGQDEAKFYEDGYIFQLVDGNVTEAYQFKEIGDVKSLGSSYTEDKMEAANNARIDVTFNSVDEKYYSDVKVGVLDADAMTAYYDYIKGNIADSSGEYLKDIPKTHDIEFYFLHSDNNQVPLLVFADTEHKFPPAYVVYYNEQIVRLVFFKKWTFSDVDAGSYGGAYKDSMYTMETPWGAENVVGTPLDMTFYRIDSSTFGVTTNKVVVCASEDDYNAGIDANPDAKHYDSYDSYLEKVKADFPEADYRYFYTNGDGFTDDDGNAFNSYDAICSFYGATDDFKTTFRNRLAE